ncbi:MAG: phosphoglycerate dehydrogenase [Nitriliruptoraceae bacterium]
MKILVADELAQAGVDLLRVDHDVDVRTGLSKDELLAIVAPYHAIVVRSQTTIDADVLAAATELRVVARAGVGLDNVDVEAATRHGVMVCNAPQSNIVSAAEHTVALLLSLARNIPQAHAALVAGRWERKEWNGTELQDKVLGILGLGRIGTLVAQRCHAFGMRLVAYDPFVAPERAARIGVDLVSTVDEVLERADFVTVHLPRTPETENIIDAQRLRLMKPTARLLNVARGGLVDEAALAEAARDGTIAGAAVDVFADEPVTASPLFGLPNVIVTPHLGASTVEAQDKAGVQVAEYVDLALRGEFVPSAVNVDSGEISDAVRPFLPLAEKLGSLLTVLAEEGLSGDVSVECIGDIASEDGRIIGLSVLRGLLAPISSEPVTYVNAPLFAEERGLRIRVVSDTHRGDFVSVLRVEGEARDGRRIRIAGTLLQPGNRERLIEVWNMPIDVEPADHMAFFRYEDRPGVIGTIGTVFGEAGVNIASAQVGRSGIDNEAIMAVSLDERVPPRLLEVIVERIGALEGRAISLA